MLFVLTQIPYLKPNILVCNCFHIETNGWNRGHDFTLMKAVQNCGLPSIIQP